MLDHHAIAQPRLSPWLRLQHSQVLHFLPATLLTLAILLLLCSSYYGYLWFQAKQLHQAYAKRSIISHARHPSSAHEAYAIAYLLAQNISKKADVETVLSLLSQAELAENPQLRAQAKYASGNLYFDLAMQSSKISEGGAHQQAVAQIELARESYKQALRIAPTMYQAKFNLELLDRLSPEKRTQGWLAETDGVTLQPFKRNGTAMMKDNTRRGLP